MNDPTDWFIQVVGHTALVEADGFELTGTVDNVDGATCSIFCDQECWPVGETREVSISVFAPDALYRLSGDAVSAEKGVVCDGGMRVERIQRRRWPRCRMDLPVTLCPIDRASHVEGIPGRTVDISVGGACVETLRPVEGEGDPMVILRLPNGATVVCNSTTVAAEEVEDGWRYRLAFRDMEDADAALLESLITPAE